MTYNNGLAHDHLAAWDVLEYNRKHTLEVKKSEWRIISKDLRRGGLSPESRNALEKRIEEIKSEISDISRWKPSNY